MLVQLYNLLLIYYYMLLMWQFSFSVLYRRCICTASPKFTPMPQNLLTWASNKKSWKPESRSSTCWLRMPRVERSVRNLVPFTSLKFLNNFLKFWIIGWLVLNVDVAKSRNFEISRHQKRRRRISFKCSFDSVVISVVYRHASDWTNNRVWLI